MPASAVQALLAIGCGLLLRQVVGLEPIAWLAWVAPGQLLALTLRVDAIRARRLTALAAVVATSANVGFYVRVMPPAVAAMVVLAQALLWLAIVGQARRLMLRDGRPWTVLVYPLLWTAADTLMARLLPDGNWASLAYTQAEVLPVLQIASVLGTAGIVFLVSLVPSALAFASAPAGRTRGVFVTCAATALLVAASVTFGVLRLRTADAGVETVFGLAAIDDAIGLQATPAYVATHRAAYAAHVGALATQGATLVLLPEKLAVAGPAAAADWQRWFGGLAAAHRVWLLGSVTIDDGGPPENRAWLFDPRGALTTAFLKHHLAPPERHYRTGSTFAVQPIAPLTYGIGICKDMHFARFGRAYGQRGVDVMLVPAWDFTLDRWMGARMTAVRGVEQGYMVVRAARDGLLTVSDAYGRVLSEQASSPLPGRALLVRAVVPRQRHTVYTRAGDWFGWGAVIVALALVVGTRVR